MTTCTCTDALTFLYPRCRFVMSAAARPIMDDLQWWNDEEIAALGWGFVDDYHGEQETDSCEDPEPIMMECECGAVFDEDRFNDHNCYARAGASREARYIEHYYE